MRIIGCDLHARQQTLAMLDTLTGEVVTRTLMHEGNAVREFYAEAAGGEALSGDLEALPSDIREATLFCAYPNFEKPQATIT